MLGDELRRMVEARMVAPLVDDLELRGLDRHVVDGVLRDDRQMIALDHLRDAVVDLRVDVVRTADEHDDLLARLLHALEDLRAVVAHILTVLRELAVGLVDCLGNLFLRQALMSAELLVESLGHRFSSLIGRNGCRKSMCFSRRMSMLPRMFSAYEATIGQL